MTLTLSFETAPYASAKSKQFADFNGHRFLVCRERIGSRNFTCVIDGRSIRCSHNTMDKAKEHITDLAEQRFS